MFDIIIPVLNEECFIRRYRSYFEWLASCASLIFVDGGSGDDTVAVCRHWGEVISSPRRGRGVQKNAGGYLSRKDYVLFLHVDTFLTPEALEALHQTVKKKYPLSCLTMRIQDPRKIFRFYEYCVNLRARHLGVLDGDLGLLISTDVFRQAGGFPEWLYMEDICLGDRLRTFQKVHLIKASLDVSSRKWQERGMWTTFCQYLKAYYQYWNKKVPCS